MIDLDLLNNLPYVPNPPLSEKELLKELGIRRVGESIKCSYCDGEGRAYRWKDRDVIEGWKMASKHTCEECGGKKVVSSTEKFANNEKKIAKHNEYVKNFNDTAKLLNKIRKHLTQSERRATNLLKEIKLLKKVR